MLPPSLKNRPEHKPEQDWFFDLFNTLTRYRLWHEGIPNPISLSDIYCHLDELRVSDREFRSFLVRLISEMDQVYIGHFVEKRQQEMERVKNKK